MTRSVEAAAELELAKDLIHNHTTVLEAQGFSYLGSEVRNSKVTTDYVVFVFRNENTKFAIRLAYFPWSGKYRGFFVTITNPKGNDLDVNEYLRQHGRHQPLAYFVNHNRGTDLHSFWSEFFLTLRNLLSTDLKAIATGEKWEEVPFNWDGYR